MDAKLDGDREVLTYEGFGLAVRELAQAVAASGFEPDWIVAIARGGLPIGGALGYALSMKNIATLNVEFYTDETLQMVIDLLSPSVSEVRSAVLYEKTRSIVSPDFTWKHTDEWINFPWSSDPPVR